MKTYDQFIIELIETVDKATFGNKFKKLYFDVAKHAVKNAAEGDDDAAKAARSTLKTPWNLTGHTKGKFAADKEIEKMKEKAFGKVGSTDLFFYTDQGMVSFPVHDGDMTHMKLMALDPTKDADQIKKGKINLDNLAKVQNSNTKLLGYGRIQHQKEKGSGIISYAPLKGGEGSTKGIVRSLERQYPKYVVHNGLGDQYGEDPDTIRQRNADGKSVSAILAKIGGSSPTPPAAPKKQQQDKAEVAADRAKPKATAATKGKKAIAADQEKKQDPSVGKKGFRYGHDYIKVRKQQEGGKPERSFWEVAEPTGDNHYGGKNSDGEIRYFNTLVKARDWARSH